LEKGNEWARERWRAKKAKGYDCVCWEDLSRWMKSDRWIVALRWVSVTPAQRGECHPQHVAKPPQWVESVNVLRRNGFCRFVMMMWCWRGWSSVSLSLSIRCMFSSHVRTWITSFLPKQGQILVNVFLFF